MPSSFLKLVPAAAILLILSCANLPLPRAGVTALSNNTSPSPTLSTLFSVFMVNADDGWAVGESGTVIRWNGNRWMDFASPTNLTLRSVSVVNADDGWAVGVQGAIIHWNGTGWETASSPTLADLFSVCMVGAGDGWAVGQSGTVIHWDGNQWMNSTSPTILQAKQYALYSVSMINSDDGWAVGDDMIHWNGTSWKEIQDQAVPQVLPVYSVFMVDSNDGWAVGALGRVTHWNGTQWTDLESVGGPRYNFFSVFMTSANDGWMVGGRGNIFLQGYTTTIFHWDGTQWTYIGGPATSELFSVFMVDSNDGWAVGAQGTILHWNGIEWIKEFPYGTICINADGSITPSTVPISTVDNVTYKVTGNINKPVAVLRDNITLDGAGYTIQGSGTGIGVDLESVNNVTLENISVTGFSSGIWLSSSSNNTVSGSKVNGNSDDGISLHSSSHNTLSADVASGNSGYGIALYSSSNNTLSDDNETENNGLGGGTHLGGAGIYLESSSNNTLSSNIETSNIYGIVFDSSSDNVLFENVIDSSIWGSFVFYGSVLTDYINWIDASNLVNGKPVYYYVNQEGLMISPGTHPSVGYLALVNCTNITVENLTLTDKSEKGLLLAFTTDSTITKNNIFNGDYGIYLYSSFENTVSDNNVTGSTAHGIELYSSSSNTVCDNNLTGNLGGISLSDDSNNTVSDNNVTGNPGGIGLGPHSSNDTVSGNIVAGSTSWGMWLIDSSNSMVSGNNVIGNNYDGIIFDFSFNDTLSGNNVTGNFGVGIHVDDCFNETLTENNVSGNTADAIRIDTSSNNTVSANNIVGNGGGIGLISSSGNTLSGNNVTGSTSWGISLADSSSNSIYHNNFVGNTEAAASISGSNSWDSGYPSGGNYWSNYAGSDSRSSPYQNETGSDGIGDTPHVVNANNTDHYPLMAPITSLNAGTWNGTAYNVSILSNSTVSNLQIDIANKTVSFNVTGLESTHGFCRVTIPNIIVQDLWHGNYIVRLNDESWSFKNWTDPINTYIYINYTHSEHEVVIIPESPSTMTVWLFTAFSMLVVALAKRRTPRKLKT